MNQPIGPWYCYVGDRQFGPLDDAELRQWIVEGRLGFNDLLWREGMTDWAPASQAAPQHFGPPGPADPRVVGYGVNPAWMTNAPPPTGGAGAAIDEITAAARRRLQGDWGLPIGFCVLLWLIYMAMSFLPYVGGLASLVVTGPLALGEAIFFLNYTRNGRAEIGQMFKGFERFGAALGAYLLIYLLTTLGMLLLIVPGVILALMFSQTFYILADDRNIGFWDAMTRSKELMRGHKLRLFELYLRLFLWSLACLLTCGIGFIWLAPYAQACMAVFWDDLPKPGGFPVAQAALPAETVSAGSAPAE